MCVPYVGSRDGVKLRSWDAAGILILKSLWGYLQLAGRLWGLSLCLLPMASGSFQNVPELGERRDGNRSLNIYQSTTNPWVRTGQKVILPIKVLEGVAGMWSVTLELRADPVLLPCLHLAIYKWHGSTRGHPGPPVTAIVTTNGRVSSARTKSHSAQGKGKAQAHQEQC